MDDLIYLNILQDLEDQEGEEIEAENNINLGNPFALSNEKFRKRFRLTKNAFNYIFEIVRPYLKEAVKSTDVDPALKLLIALKFFATGSYQLDVGNNYLLGVSQSTTSRCIHEVIDIFNRQEIVDRFIKFPQTIAELNSVRRKFYELYGFPGIIGCIDCTHVALFPPNINDPNFPEYLYVNRKGYHSINVQLICDDKLKIMNVCSRYPGSTHDSYIWNNSPVQEMLQNLHRDGNNDYFLLGDSGYALRSWLLTPFTPEPDTATPEAEYNKQHKKIRSIIERCNGVLKIRFRCLLKHRVLHYDPQTTCKIILTCCILHNICIDFNSGFEDGDFDEDEAENVDLGMYNENANLPNQQNNAVNPDLTAGRQQRSRIVGYLTR